MQLLHCSILKMPFVWHPKPAWSELYTMQNPASEAGAAHPEDRKGHSSLKTQGIPARQSRHLSYA